MEAYLNQLIAIQKQVNGLVEEIQSHLLREKIGAGPPVEAPKKRGRPAKVVATAPVSADEPEKPKRTMTEEHKQKLREGRERAKAARDAEKAAASLAASETSSVAEVSETEAPPTVEAAPVVETAPAVEATPVVEAAPVDEKPKKRIVVRKQPVKPSDPSDDEKPTEEQIYKYMFELQESGVCNMLGSETYLRKRFSSLSPREAEDIVLNYMSNYKELFAKYGN